MSWPVRLLRAVSGAVVLKLSAAHVTTQGHADIPGRGHADVLGLHSADPATHCLQHYGELAPPLTLALLRAASEGLSSADRVGCHPGPARGSELSHPNTYVFYELLEPVQNKAAGRL